MECTAVDIIYNVIEPGASSSRSPEICDLVGHEFGHVITGKVCVEIEGQKHVLNSGESICFMASSDHVISNLTNAPATMLWVLSSEKARVEENH